MKELKRRLKYFAETLKDHKEYVDCLYKKALRRTFEECVLFIVVKS